MPDTQPTSALSAYRVLVADDDVLIGEALDVFLTALGCTVVGPYRSLGALQRAIRTDTGAVDLALVDIHLGAERVDPALRQLAQRRIPFVLLTGDQRQSDEPTLAARAPRLTKPFTFRQLERIMRGTFGRAPATSQDGGADGLGKKSGSKGTPRARTA